MPLHGETESDRLHLAGRACIRDADCGALPVRRVLKAKVRKELDRELLRRRELGEGETRSRGVTRLLASCAGFRAREEVPELEAQRLDDGLHLASREALKEEAPVVALAHTEAVGVVLVRRAACRPAVAGLADAF